ncbi:hypothetical protein DW881_11645 [Exiguobacterium sp. AM39-5BH]|nr:hypothetical protein DW881_11645 [Exiguobacterium sp. AM39-5BH]
MLKKRKARASATKPTPSLDVPSFLADLERSIRKYVWQSDEYFPSAQHKVRDMTLHFGDLAFL